MKVPFPPPHDAAYNPSAILQIRKIPFIACIFVARVSTAPVFEEPVSVVGAFIANPPVKQSSHSRQPRSVTTAPRFSSVPLRTANPSV